MNKALPRNSPRCVVSVVEILVVVAILSAQFAFLMPGINAARERREMPLLFPTLAPPYAENPWPTVFFTPVVCTSGAALLMGAIYVLLPKSARKHFSWRVREAGAVSRDQAPSVAIENGRAGAPSDQDDTVFRFTLRGLARSLFFISVGLSCGAYYFNTTRLRSDAFLEFAFATSGAASFVSIAIGLVMLLKLRRPSILFIAMLIAVVPGLVAGVYTADAIVPGYSSRVATEADRFMGKKIEFVSVHAAMLLVWAIPVVGMVSSYWLFRRRHAA